MKQLRIHYLKIIRWAVVVAIFFFLGKVVWENWAQVKEASFSFNPFGFILSTLIFAFSYFMLTCVWYLITITLGVSIPFSETVESWFYSQLGKYLPGKVWVLLGRFYFYESKGKSKATIFIAFYFEMVSVIVAGSFISWVALIVFKESMSFYSLKQFWVILLCFFCLISLHPRFIQKILNWILMKFKREPVSLLISYSNILLIVFVCVIAWVIGGIGFYFFVNSVFSVSSQHVLFLTGSLAFSSILGLISVFAPSGLGVREGALVYLLSSVMPAPVAVIISVLTRLWMTFIEIGLMGAIYITRRIQGKQLFRSTRMNKT
jgi:glycosyltransferase 2 family protein